MPIERSPIKDEPEHRINEEDAIGPGIAALTWAAIVELNPGAASSYSEKAARRTCERRADKR